MRPSVSDAQDVRRPRFIGYSLPSGLVHRNLRPKEEAVLNGLPAHHVRRDLVPIVIRLVGMADIRLHNLVFLFNMEVGDDQGRHSK